MSDEWRLLRRLSHRLKAVRGAEAPQEAKRMNSAAIWMNC